MVVPSQPFRTSALGILLAVGFVLAASLTLLPALLARLGPRIDRFALPWAGAVQHRSEAFARWGRLIWRRPVVIGGLALVVLARARPPGTRPPHGHAGDRRPARGRERARRLRAASRRPSAPGRPPSCRSWHRREKSERVRAALRPHPRRGRRGADGATGDLALTRVRPVSEGKRVHRERALATAKWRARRRRGRRGPRSGARPRRPASARLRPGGGCRLCAAGARGPRTARGRGGRSYEPARHGGGLRPGEADLPFQDGHGETPARLLLPGLFDAWAPIFFFALIFALAMDYSVFLLSSIRAELIAPAIHDPPSSRGSRARAGDQRSRRGDGGRVLHLRPLRTARAEGNGRDPGRGGAARHATRSPAATPGRPAPARPGRMVDAAPAGPTPAGSCPRHDEPRSRLLRIR